MTRPDSAPSRRRRKLDARKTPGGLADQAMRRAGRHGRIRDQGLRDEIARAVMRRR